MNCLRSSKGLLAALNYFTRRDSYRLTSPRLCSKASWSRPDGYDTGIKVYVPSLRKNVPLILKQKAFATWYMCGPTVYSDAHIGHARYGNGMFNCFCGCYVKFDIVKRIMQNMFNIEVVTLMGITDVDDKIIDKAQKYGCSIADIARHYERDFFQDLKMLNVDHPTLVTHVTDFIPQIMSFCEVLIEKGFAYVTSNGNVYFSVAKLDKDKQSGDHYFTIKADPMKRDPRDFALWKAAKPGEPYWTSPWGNGRPGWHIECSAMASCVFGNHLDIHSGGADLQFPHHANEISQSEAYHGVKPWVSYWLHAGLLNVDKDVKMSKSLGNMITVKDFLRESTSNVFRILCLQSHYRSNIQYSDEELQLASGIHSKFHIFLNDAEAYIAGDMPCPCLDGSDLMEKFFNTREKIYDALADDFNTSYTVACLAHLVGDSMKCLQNKSEGSAVKSIKIISTIASYVDRTLEMLGVSIINKQKLPMVFVCCVDVVISFRSAVRQQALPVSSASNAAGTCVSFSPYTQSTDYKHNDDMDTNMSKLFEDAKQKLYTLGIIVNTDNSFTFSSGDSIVSCTDVKYVLDAFLAFSINVHSAVSAHNKLDTSAVMTRRQETMRTKVKRERLRTDLLQATDVFRDELKHVGIGIKDTPTKSTWFPMENHFESMVSLRYKML